MGKIESYISGSFCWAELATSDIEAAKRFYSEMFGWTAVDNVMPQGIYTIFESEGNKAAGAFQMPGVPTHWGAHFSTPSADESAAKAGTLGGKVIMGPFDAHDKGRMAIVQDPQGATFTLWQAKTEIGATHGGPLNQFCWPELTTPDPAAAAAFYTGLFGWSTKPADGVGNAEYVEWVNAGRSIGGLMPMRGEMWKGIPPHWMLYVSVANCDERTAKAGQLGARICVSPTDIPNVGRFSVITDPHGAALSLVQLARASQPAGA